MNYLEIVLQGYFNKNNREFLDSYFFEKFKKAEKEHFCNADKFFNGCLDITKYWTKYLNKLVLEHKREMYFMLNEAKKYNLKYDKKEHKSLEQNQKETIEYCEQELNNLNIFNYSINLSSIKNGGIPYNLQYNEVLFIENAILQAYEKTQSEIEHSKPQPIVKQSDKLSDLITHKKSIEIIEAIKIQYKNIKGKRLKLLLLALQYLDLLPKERIANKFHDCCKNEFDWDIASYNAMNGYTYNDMIDKVEFGNIIEYLKTFIEEK